MKEIFKKYKLIPLATLKSKEEVKNISRLLLNNNIPIFELTLRDSAAYDIADEFQNFPEINIGIGTINTKSDIDFEVIQAISRGHDILKFFPAEAFNGLSVLKGYQNVFQGISFMPTGGINNNNMQDYLELDNVIAVGASSLLPQELIASKDWDQLDARLKNHLIYT
ncbi:MAG: hypothetical protein VW946_03560 [Gammaproteobacteria bacterium]